MRKLGSVFIVLLLASLLVACGEDEAGDAGIDEKNIVVGVTSGPQEEIAEVAAEVAAEEFGLEVELKVFSDYVLPNTALSEGDLDLNSYQHEPFLTSLTKTMVQI